MTDTVRIGDREFRIGATYAPSDQKALGPRGRVLVQGPLHPCRGDVIYRFEGDPPVKLRHVWFSVWLRWAGDEVTP